MEEYDEEKATIIVDRMPHKRYVAVVDYIESLPNHKDGKGKPLRITNIEEVVPMEEPPIYAGVHIEIESFSYPQARENTMNAVEGLAKVLFGELSVAKE